MNLTVAEKRNSFVSLPDKNGGKEIFYPESDGKPMGETAFHVDVILTLFQTLKTFFSGQTDIVVIADMMFYYEEGNPRKVIAPDVMVVKGVKNYSRRIFKLWEEKTPDVIFEISSKKTWREDLRKKFTLYQEFGVSEYYIFDPEYNYLKDAPFIAYHLEDGEFKAVKLKRGRVFSPALNLEIVDTGETLRLFNTETRKFLPTMEELTSRAEKVESLESEVEKLKAELAKLKRQN
ncbi:MAG: Uma2 family endonuclease [Pyrinomonadaceae bacterium]|nr:Uma2 family endonuclease [Pyrinomonadaceae bacterium]